MDWTAEMQQQDLLRDSAMQLGRIDERARQIAGPLTGAQLDWVPPDGGWSIARVLDHLAVTNQSYLDALARAIERGRSRGPPAAGAVWKPSLAGRFLIRSLDPASTRRVPTPRAWRPVADTPPQPLERFLASQARLAGLIQEAAGVDLVRTRLSSPASRLIRLGVGDAFRVFAVHGWRHMDQIDRVRGNDGFPDAESTPSPQTSENEPVAD